jgi:hypothetical protein
MNPPKILDTGKEAGGGPMIWSENERAAEAALE